MRQVESLLGRAAIRMEMAKSSGQNDEEMRRDGFRLGTETDLDSD